VKDLLTKELRLAMSPLTALFLLAAALTLVPGYPILLGAFFACMGIFQSFLAAREANDTLYTVLLPVRKSDFVRAKYAFCCLFELLAFAIMAALTALRMTALAGAAVYRTNALMNATPLFLACALVIFAEFNAVFLGTFFRTAYNVGVPFFLFIAVCMVTVFAGEAIHFLPGLAFFNAPAGDRMGLQLALLGGAAVLYAGVTALSCRASIRKFERIDL